MSSLTVYRIPVCPFSQRLEILLALKDMTDAVRFVTVDITQPRDPDLLAMTDGATELPVGELDDGKVIKESLVILQYLEDRFPEPRVAQRDPYRRAIENMLVTMEREFVAAGYGFVMNQDPARREARRDRYLAIYAALDRFLVRHGPDRTFLFEQFGWAEAVFTPMFMRFWFVDYYEGFELPEEPRFARVRAWRDACLAHPAAQQVTREEIIKSYYDYAKGAGNGELLPGRSRSSFVFEPHWSQRPWPPKDKYAGSASDADLGL